MVASRSSQNVSCSLSLLVRPVQRHNVSWLPLGVKRSTVSCRLILLALEVEHLHNVFCSLKLRVPQGVQHLHTVSCSLNLRVLQGAQHLHTVSCSLNLRVQQGVQHLHTVSCSLSLRVQQGAQHLHTAS